MIGTALEVVNPTTADGEVGLLAEIGQRLLSFCERFGSHFRSQTRTVETPMQHYLRGLLQAETKNMERMEEVIPEADHQALQHLLSESAWEERAVLDQVAQDANRHLGGHSDSSLLIDESGCPKKGKHSVGVARQWCGQLGKVENCQVGVFAALGRGAEATLIDERLFLPEQWTADPARCQAAGIPAEQRDFKRKHDLAGVYDLTANQGWVSVGITHDTAEFAVATLHRWWQQMGSRVYPHAQDLVVTADSGGSNGRRCRRWKVELQKLADTTGLWISVCHFPPGTSKWNKIEHRLFCHITENWRGRPLLSHAIIVNLIGHTTTRTGLQIQAELDRHIYRTGIKVSKVELDAVRLEKDAFHGEWNYTILPHISKNKIEQLIS
jgi:hypothetical protein